MSLYAGFDSSTQSLTAVVVEIDDQKRDVVFEHTVVFDADFPEYETEHGVLPGGDPSVVVAPPAMWGAALERMMGTLAASSLDLSSVAAITGAGQQHGSVYLNGTTPGILAGLDPGASLAEQLEPVFSRPIAPIWMDTSTTTECDEITAAIGGAGKVVELTGSRAFERFTGPQIRKFFKRDPEAWRDTERVHLVSSFMASLLRGADAPLDPGDASGMNLMDIASRVWSPTALDATAPDLAAKLPDIVPASTIVGELASYWQARFGFPSAKIVAWTGDNPSSLIGTGLIHEGQVAVSLGTSDTIFGPMNEPRVDLSGVGHVFGAPTGDYMGLTCFRNGSLARERVRDDHGLDWHGFSEALRSTAPGNGGALLLPWFDPEITPDVSDPRPHRLHLDPEDTAGNVRAVVEAQMMSMANHSRWMGVDIDVIHATGGAAANPDILQVMADVFDAEVRRFEVSNSACLGAALRAYHAHAAYSGTDLRWEDVIVGLAEPLEGSAIIPDPAAIRTYAAVRREYAEFEREHLPARSPRKPVP